MSGSRDGILHLWDAQARKGLGTCRGDHLALCLAFAPDCKTFVSGGRTNDVRLWDVASRIPLQSAAALGPVHGAAFTPDGKTVVAGGDDRTLRLLDTATWNERAPPRGHIGAVRAAVFTPDGRKLISAGGDHTIKVWDLAAPDREPKSLHRHAGAIVSLALAPNGQTLVSASWDGTVRVWNLADGTEQAVLADHNGLISVAFAPDGKTLATGDNAGIRLWDPANMARPLHVLAKDDINPDYKLTDGRIFITGLAFSPDCRVLASIDASKTVKLWEVTTAKEIAGPRIFADRFAFAPDGKTLAVAEMANTKDGPVYLVKLWDVDQRKWRADLLPHHVRITALAFDLDSQALVSADEAGEIQWQTVAGREKGKWQLPGAVYGLAFSPDGCHLATANANGTVYVLRLLPAGAAGTRSHQSSAISAK